MSLSPGAISDTRPLAPGVPGARVLAAAELAAASPVPMLLVWGAARQRILNDAWLRFGIGDEPLDANGLAWASLPRTVHEAIDACFAQGAAVTCPDQLLPDGAAPVAAHWCTLYCIPVSDNGQVVAVMCALVDTSEHVRVLARLAEVEEQARRRAEAFSIVYSNMEESAFHVRRDSNGNFRFESINDAFCRATGLAREEVVGRRVQDVVPGESADLVLAHHQEAFASGTTVRWEESSHYPTGQRIGSVSVTPVRGADGRCTDLIGTVHDITELKRVEAQLRSANAGLEQLAAELRVSEERLNYALDSAGEGVWDWDIVRGTMFFSKRWREILGLPPDVEADFDFWWSRMHPDDIDTTRATLQECLTGVRPVCIEVHRLWHDSGRWIWVEARGSVVARSEDGTALRMVGTIIDITATTELRQALERTHDLLAKLAQQVPGALFQLVLKPSGQVVCPFISAMSTELFAHTPAEIEGNFKCLLHCINRTDRAHLRHSMRESASRLQPWRAEFRVSLHGNRDCWRELTAKPARLADGSVIWHGFTSDITQRKRTEATIRQFNEKLERRAHYDALTGLPNRALFRDRLEQEMRHAHASGRGMALLFIDLDRFKEVNDLLGHDAGDALLAHAARRIGHCLRPGDTVARLGGDEFTVILTDSGEVGHAEQVAQKIIDVLRAPFRIGIEQANISASIGITLYPGDGEHPEELMRNADHAMYRSKGAGRNRLAFFEPAMQAQAMRRLRLTHELRRALPDHQLALYFQPIVDIRSGQICKAEALLRWHRPGHDLALPTEFIGIAEETGLIHDIGNWVFLEAARRARDWSAMLGRRFQISINKSPVQFQRHTHVLDWVGHLDREGMAHNSIAIEITESLLLNVSDAVFNRLHELQAGGIEVSIDDFGTGYSSMTYLKRLDIDYLKIDRSFVAEMLQDSTSQTITETIIVMAHKLGLKVIAEGVETEAQRDWLVDQGCDYLQGFLFGRPVEAGQFEALLASQPFAAGARMGGALPH
jgi:diguanylate cyclase (GGDEF)-like protein/PAS domain S-box-containing protein